MNLYSHSIMETDKNPRSGFERNSIYYKDCSNCCFILSMRSGIHDLWFDAYLCLLDGSSRKEFSLGSAIIKLKWGSPNLEPWKWSPSNNHWEFRSLSSTMPDILAYSKTLMNDHYLNPDNMWDRAVIEAVSQGLIG